MPPVSGGRSRRRPGRRRARPPSRAAPSTGSPPSGTPGRRGAEPGRLAVPLDQGGGAADADERVARPGRPGRAGALLGRLQQEGARAAGQLGVDADRGLAVGQQPAGHRHHPAPRSRRKVASSGRTAPLVMSPPRGHRQLVGEAGVRAGVAGRADLLHGDQQRVAVAVQRHRPHVLVVAGGRALHPVLPAAARPVGGPAGGQRAMQRLVVHPGEHQHVAGAVLAHDRGDETVGGRA